MVLSLTSVCHAAPAQSIIAMVGDARVDRPLGHVTLVKKLTLLHSGRKNPSVYVGQAGYIGGVPRLGVPGLRLADVAGVICAYNHVNGAYACGAGSILTAILGHELEFKGSVTSEWRAAHSTLFMNAGLDVEIFDGPDSSGYQEPAFLGPEAAAPPPADPDGDIFGGQIPEETSPALPDSTDLGSKIAPKTRSEALKTAR